MWEDCCQVPVLYIHTSVGQLWQKPDQRGPQLPKATCPQLFYGRHLFKSIIKNIMELKTVRNGYEYWQDAFGQDSSLSCDMQQERMTHIFIAHRRGASILHGLGRASGTTTAPLTPTPPPTICICFSYKAIWDLFWWKPRPGRDQGSSWEMVVWQNTLWFWLGRSKEMADGAMSSVDSVQPQHFQGSRLGDVFVVADLSLKCMCWSLKVRSDMKMGLRFGLG